MNPCDQRLASDVGNIKALHEEGHRYLAPALKGVSPFRAIGSCSLFGSVARARSSEGMRVLPRTLLLLSA